VKSRGGFCWLWYHQCAHFCVAHALHLTHLLAEELCLYRLVYYPVTHGENCLAREALSYEVDEALGALEKGVETLDICGKRLALQTGNEAPCECSPVAFAQQWGVLPSRVRAAVGW